MRGSASRVLPNPARLRELITHISWGESVQDAGLRYNTRVVLLPLTAHVDRGEARITWTPSNVVTPDTTVSWTYVERGKTFTGTATVDADWVHGDYPDASYPVGAVARQVSEQANLARWNLIQELEPAVREALANSNAYVAREIEGRLGGEFEGWGQALNHGAVSHSELEQAATRLLFGDKGRDSTVLRMVKRAARTTINNQPLGPWFDRNLCARAEEEVRRLIGDPHVGRKVRKVYREHLPANLNELLELYRRAHPKDRLGAERAIQALTAGKTLDAQSASLALFGGAS